MDDGEKMKLLEEVRKIDGWLMDHQAVTLMNFADKYIHSGSIVVELGVWKGKSTRIWGEYAKRRGAKVYGIDTFAGVPKKEDPSNLMYYHEATNPTEFMDKYAKKAVAGLPVYLIAGRTDEKMHLFADKSIDLCFIDADHSYEGVSKDIKNWFPKIKDMGLFCGHDYNEVGVQKAVKELLPDYGVESEIWLTLG